MRPLDPRLLRYAVSARWFLATGAVLGVATTASILAFAWLITKCITGAIEGQSLGDLLPFIGMLAAVALLRALLVYAQDLVAARGAARVKSELRLGVLDAVRRLGPAFLAEKNSARVATLLGRGMDALDDYFSKYLPQLILTVIVTPIVVLVVLLSDWLSAVFILVTLPLIPIFMILIGWATQAVQRRQWTVLGDLSSGFVDTLGGLATLKIFGRESRQVKRMRSITTFYRIETMRVLRVSFLSSFALELAASLSVALVAVSIGLRLVDGSLGLTVGLFVLLLAPEAFLPLRQVGANFHAAAEGVAAAEDAFTILDDARSLPAVESQTATDARGVSAGVLSVDHVTVDYGAGAVAAPVTAEFRPHELTVIAGPSGTGKSSLLAAILGFAPFSGSVRFANRPVPCSADERGWLAWTGQRPSLSVGTVSENVALGSDAVDHGLVRRALDLAAAPEIDPDLAVGVAGAGLSGGQAQRVALARAIYRTLDRRSAVLLLDEPTSALDHGTEARLLDGLRIVAESGVAVIVVSHRQAVINRADALVSLSSRTVVAA
ncbi:ATP-binding cassette subfamily C protein CydD [Okibacterium sp. HSC-33S16]|uniref:thiol reductant ABC exporter subunit CydD n=1 Tax=Okibacterium sp. HSC-33S16 TaxID=2910965 RepID=UPI00209F89F4|nr:thiol reductant ABC exporter subunit CydD [Okibacterium sp. HSC-33S16]MCP2030688.1 ATP-binding cassette subfamily C protein CydD [Okibacterium sp. HSC-33S16]